MLALLYMPVIVLTVLIESQLKGKPLTGFSLSNAEFFARHLMHIHFAMAALCLTVLVTFVFSS